MLQEKQNNSCLTNNKLEIRQNSFQKLMIDRTETGEIFIEMNEVAALQHGLFKRQLRKEIDTSKFKVGTVTNLVTHSMIVPLTKGHFLLQMLREKHHNEVNTGKTGT